jgi:TolA-binding protein
MPDFILFAAAPAPLDCLVMARSWRRSLFVWALIFSVARLCAADPSENRAYRVAEKAFQIQSWEFAAKQFGEFVEKYPQSPQAPEAILFQAKARYQLNQFEEAMELLSTNRSKAGMWADEYLYWLAQTQVRLTNLVAAADAFAELIKGFPDSPRRLEATVAEAAAIARLTQWPRVTALLEDPEGVFQQAAKSEPANEFVFRGYLLLGDAQLATDNLNGVQTTLELMPPQTLNRELRWQREYLQCRLQLAAGQTESALETASNLVALAGGSVPAQSKTNAAAQPEAGDYDTGVSAASLLSKSWSFLASILEATNRFDDAIAAYRNNLVTNAPVDEQRHALFKIAELYLAQNQYALATKTLEAYLDQHPDSGAADMALLTTGELQLKQHELAGKTSADNPAPGAVATNLIEEARSRFDRLLTAFQKSPLAGKALLDEGWCFWIEGKYAPSEELFRSAAQQLPFSQDQAVARFKWGDAQFMVSDYAGAVTNYDFVATHYSSLPGLNPWLPELALYQTVRAALSNDVTAATRAMRRIMDSYPNGFAGPHCLLLLGQGLAQRGDAAGARELFADFEKAYPTNSLLPEVRLAVARSYEREDKWDAAVSEYRDWISRFTNHAELPRAEFYLARDDFMAGRATNAFVLFTNFIARFPTNELAQQAQWWIADYHFGQGRFHDAEINYQWIYQNTNWPLSELTYQAQMKAGWAAMASYGYKDAFGYFTNLAANPACPLDLRIQATYDAGAASMSRTDSDATNRFQEAISWFGTIPQSYPTNPLAPLALGMIGNCYLQLADTDHPKFYENAANAYQQVITNSPPASVAARSQAMVGLGLVAEGLAKLKSGAAQTALLNQALEDYLRVFFYENNVRDGEHADLFWLKKAGLEAGRVAETLQQWQEVIIIYQELEEWLPQMRLTLEKKILNAQKNLAREK